MNQLKKIKFQNHWLDVLDSVEENLKYYRRRSLKTGATSGEKFAAPHAQNDWLNCVSRVETVLQTLSLHSTNLAEQAKLLQGEGLVSQRAYRLIERFQMLGTQLAERSVSPQTRELHSEYCQLADQIMPTLARINKRVAARRNLIACGADAGEIPHTLADDSMDVALRAALKRRQ